MMKIYNDNKCDDYVHESKWYNFCTNFCRNMLTHCQLLTDDGIYKNIYCIRILYIFYEINRKNYTMFTN